MAVKHFNRGAMNIASRQQQHSKAFFYFMRVVRQLPTYSDQTKFHFLPCISWRRLWIRRWIITVSVVIPTKCFKPLPIEIDNKK